MMTDSMPIPKPTELNAMTLTQNEQSNASDNNCCSNPKATCKTFTRFVLLRSLGLALYVLDMATDIAAAYGDYLAGDWVFAGVTLGLVFTPGFLFSLYMACDYLLLYFGQFACLKAPAIILVSPFLPLWIILRDIKLIFEGLAAVIFPSKRQHSMEPKPSRFYLVKFLEAFTEAAPQLLVRLLRVASRNPLSFSDLRTSEILQISFSVIVLSLKVVTTHQRNVTTSQVLAGDSELHSKFHLPWFSMVSAALWWMCFLISRFEALALFSASYRYWVVLVIGIHVAFVFFFQTATSTKDRLKKVVIYLFGAFVFVFAYVHFNLKSRLKISVWFPYIVFSVMVFVENSVMLTFWFYDQRSNLDSMMEEKNLSALFPANHSVVHTGLAATITEEQLTKHWRKLLYVHYGIFVLGLLFMIFTFCCTSRRNKNQLDLESSCNPREAEIELLNNSLFS